MRRFFLVLLFLFCISINKINAAELSVASIRTDRMQSSQSPLPILILLKPTTNSVENKIKITVGSGYSIDNSNINISNSGLPNGVLTVSGLSVNSINGQEIIFDCNDLVLGNTYGFFITTGIGINPATDSKWKIQTYNGVNLIDGIEVKVPINNDQVTVTGRVGAKASDFQIEITADKSGNLSVDDEVIYTINYGSYLHTLTKPLVISGEWSRGTVSGSPVPSVDIVDYVIGSGTTAYGGIEPVIDLVNRKITWTINPFPANTINETVSFKLKVNNSYTGSSTVNFDVSGILSGSNVVTTDAKITQSFKPVIILPTTIPSPTPTNIPGPTVTSSPSVNTQSVVATVTPTITKLQINKIEIVGLTESTVKIVVENNFVPQEIKIFYGEKINLLNKSVISINKLAKDRLTIDGLKSETDYFFRVEVDGLKSDLYTFRTALKSEAPIIDINSIIVSVANNIVLDASKEINAINSVILIPNDNYAFRVNLTKSEIIKSVKIFVRNSRVLGITSVYGAEPNFASVDLTEIVNGGFVGHLVSPREIGYYDIVLRIEDVSGNMVEEKVGQMRIVLPLKVVDKNNEAIENAKVTFYRLNIKTNIYEVMTVNSFGIKNPIFSEPDGKVYLALPKGKYRVDVSGIGYNNKTVNFEIGLGETEKMPVIVLENSKFSVLNVVNYIGNIGNDVLGYSNSYFSNLLISQRFFRLVAIIIGLMGVAVGWLFLAKGRNMKWWMLPILIKYRFVKWRNKNDKNKLFGRVIDVETKSPIASAFINLVDGDKNIILSKSKSDVLGEFVIDIKEVKKYKIVVICDGYETTDVLEYTMEGLKANNIVINLKNVISNGELVGMKIEFWWNKISQFLVMVLLILSVLLEFRFMGNFGLWQTLPWLLISLLSCFLWIRL